MNARRVRDIEYQLLPGSARNTTDIVIERNGLIVVHPPAGYSPEQVDAVVESKRLWIYRNLAEWRDLNATAVVREWVNGESDSGGMSIDHPLHQNVDRGRFSAEMIAHKITPHLRGVGGETAGADFLAK